MRISIIMAALNGGPALGGSVASLLGQSWRDLEIVIQDGGSKDGSLEALARFADGRIAVRSEPDSGIYDAWNKAVARASGDWVIFFGAGDRFLEADTLERCAALLPNLPSGCGFAYGDLIIGRGGKAAYRVSRSLRTVYSMLATDLGLPFPATFIRLSLLREHLFDPGFRIAGDYDFVARAFSAENIARLPLAVSYMEGGGVSDDDARTPQLAAERRRVAESRIIPKAEALVRGCVAHLEESACCGAKKRVRPFSDLLRRLRQGIRRRSGIRN